METTPIAAPQADTNEKLMQMFEELRTYEKKNLRINRIRMLCSGLGLLILIVALIIGLSFVGTVVSKVNDVSKIAIVTVNNINTIAEQITKVDLEKLGKSLQSIADMGEVTLRQVSTATEGLDELVKDADEAMQHINSVNFQDLNNGIKELNDVLEPIAKFFNVFR